jgi:hypothetical protein
MKTITSNCVIVENKSDFIELTNKFPQKYSYAFPDDFPMLVMWQETTSGIVTTYLNDLFIQKANNAFLEIKKGK